MADRDFRHYLRLTKIETQMHRLREDLIAHYLILKRTSVVWLNRSTILHKVVLDLYSPT